MSVERVVVRRRWAVLVGCTLLFGVAALFAARLSAVARGGPDSGPQSESSRVTRLIEREFGRGAIYQQLVVLRCDAFTTDDPRYEETVERLTRRIGALPQVHSVESAWNAERLELVGGDWRSALLVVTPRARDYLEAEAFTATLRDAIRSAGLPAGFRAEVTGATATLHDLDQTSSSDLLRAERVGLPLTAVILLVVFGAPLAALLPLVLALIAVTLGRAGLYALSPWMPVSVFAENVVSMIGLGVGVDYALFVLSRFREELAEGSAPEDAAAHAVSVAGHSVAFSGATVAVGFLALFMVRTPFLHSIALGGMIVVVAAVLAAVTLLPALLAILGHAVNWPRRVRTSARAVEPRVSFWSRWAEIVMRRRWIWVTVASAILVLLILPTLRLATWNIGPSHLSTDTGARRGFDLLDDQFPKGWIGPIVGLIEAPPGATLWEPGPRAAVLELAARLSRDRRSGTVLGFPQLLWGADAAGVAPDSLGALPPRLRAAARDVVSADGRMALIALVTPREPNHPQTMAYLRELRARRFVVGERSGLTVQWSGSSAVMADFDDEMLGSLPRVIVAVVIATMIVLGALYRSVLIPLKATVLNVVSVLAAYGFLVLVFQDGHGAHLLGLTPPGGLNSFIVRMLFTILFGLSMDYEVFLLSRIREEYERTGDNTRAVALGLGHTARIITSAALIMISIFGSFGFTSLIPTREFGLGLAFAVALDATIIRVVLVPALMVISGRWNWWPGRRTTVRAVRK
jgi:RND superfamily putative drug exporter